MQVYRDESILKGLLSTKTIEQSAELHLFLLVEQNVRKVIQVIIANILGSNQISEAFSKKIINLPRDRSSHKGLKHYKSMIAWQSKQADVVGFQYMDSINLTKRMDQYTLNDQNLDLKDLITHQMRTVKIPLGFPSIQFFNVMRDFQMINSQETQQIMQYQDIIQTESTQNAENKKSFNIIKDNIISILTMHQQQILKQFKELFEKEVTSLKFCFSTEFSQCNPFPYLIVLSDLENYKDVAQLIPFFIQYLYSQQDGAYLFYYKHRTVIIECLNRLILNHQINLECQLHQIIKILVRFLTAKVLEINIRSQIELQIKTARCLNYLLDKFNLKYQPLRQNIDRVFMKKFDKIDEKLEQKNSCKQLLKAFAIVEYFIEQNVSTQHLKFVESICSLLRKIELKQQQITQPDINYNQLVGMIQQSLGVRYTSLFKKILIKIVNGLQYLEPTNKKEIWLIISNARELMFELGLEEMIVMQQQVSEGIIL